MADTYIQIYLHFVFAVKGRQNLIPSRHKEELYKYITGVVTHNRQKLLAIGGMSDHIHALVGINHALDFSTTPEKRLKKNTSNCSKNLRLNMTKNISLNGLIRIDAANIPPLRGSGRLEDGSIGYKHVTPPGFGMELRRNFVDFIL